MRFRMLLLSVCFCLIADTSFAARSFHYSPDDLMTYLEDCPEEAASQVEDAFDSLDAPLDCLGHTLLMYACTSGCDKIISALLKKGANPDVRDDNGLFALVHCYVGPIWTHSKLLLARSDVNKTTRLGWNALMVVIANEYMPNSQKVHILQDLITAGSRLDMTIRGGGTALALAIGCRCIPCMEILMEYGADPDGGPRDYYPLRVALDYECNECLVLLIDHGALETYSRNDLLLHLSLSIEKNNHQHAAMLIESNAQLLMNKTSGETALFTLLELNLVVSLEFLLGYLQHHYPEELLQQLTALPDNKAYLGSVLAYAAFIKNDQAVGLLTRFGGSPHSEDSDDRTAIMVLASEQSLEGVRLLLQHGADINRPNSAGFTPVEEAFNRWDYAALQVIETVGGDFSPVEGHLFCFWNAYRKIDR